MQECNKAVRRHEQGFTLVELMVVVAIIAILAAIAVPKLTAFLKNAHTAAATENMGRIAQYIEGKQSINGGFSSTSTYYVVPTGTTGMTPATTNNISKVIGVELESGHEWAYFVTVNYASEETKKNLTGTCIIAVNRDGNGTSSTTTAGKYILYSKTAVTNDINWEGNFWKLAYLSDGTEWTGAASGDCATLPTAGGLTIP